MAFVDLLRSRAFGCPIEALKKPKGFSQGWEKSTPLYFGSHKALSIISVVRMGRKWSGATVPQPEAAPGF